MIMKSPQINAVRQVLMNELGLTRESVREETIKIITETVDKLVLNMLDNGSFGDIVVKAANKHLYDNREQAWSKTIQDYISQAAKDAARDWINERITITSS